MLFGTQNPAGVYGGRKVLSRAFRNRFVELHYDDILSKELVQILNLCCALPETYAKKMVSVMKHLQVHVCVYMYVQCMCVHVCVYMYIVCVYMYVQCMGVHVCV